jgi:hypothetical protein
MIFPGDFPSGLKPIAALNAREGLPRPATEFLLPAGGPPAPAYAASASVLAQGVQTLATESRSSPSTLAASRIRRTDGVSFEGPTHGPHGRPILPDVSRVHGRPCLSPDHVHRPWRAEPWPGRKTDHPRRVPPCPDCPRRAIMARGSARSPRNRHVPTTRSEATTADRTEPTAEQMR